MLLRVGRLVALGVTWWLFAPAPSMHFAVGVMVAMFAIGLVLFYLCAATGALVVAVMLDWLAGAATFLLLATALVGRYVDDPASGPEWFARLLTGWEVAAGVWYLIAAVFLVVMFFRTLGRLVTRYYGRERAARRAVPIAPAARDAGASPEELYAAGMRLLAAAREAERRPARADEA